MIQQSRIYVASLLRGVVVIVVVLAYGQEEIIPVEENGQEG